MVRADMVGGMDALTPQDATRFWLSRRTCNDLFLLYCFTDGGRSIDDLRAIVAARSARIPDLSVRVRERRFGYPVRVPHAFTGDQLVEHRLDEPVWANVVAALGDLLGHGVRADERAWRLHLFRGIAGAPGGGAPALVAVLQLSHAVADGQGAAAIARALFTEESDLSNVVPGTLGEKREARGIGDTALADREGERPAVVTEPESPVEGADAAVRTDAARGDRIVRAGDRARVAEGEMDRGADPTYCEPTTGRTRFRRGRGLLDGDLLQHACRPAAASVVRLKYIAAEAFSFVSFPISLARTVIRGLAAERARRTLAAGVERGEVPPPAPGFPPTLLNRPPEPTGHAVRMLVRDDLRVPGYTVTVVVLAAVASALSRYLESPDAELAAQVSMAMPRRNSRSRNNYRDLSIELHGRETDPRRRAERIAADLEVRRARATHPLLSAQDRVTDVLPAPVLRRDVDSYPMDLVPDALSGHTVVSSVNRGPADLAFGGGPVRFTAGFPALGAVMHLTHGVHGLGGTVTVSVHADPAVVTDIDAYARELDAALTEVRDALGDGSNSVAGR